MKKINTSPISGMQELLPAKQAIFNQLKSKIQETYRLHGFQNIETPVIDRAEVLLAKAGGDTEKQIYKVIKTAETGDDADQALRFDHTVPLARYVVEHQNDLTFPFKVSQVGRNYRGERAQKGRFRELYQLDVDVIGRSSLPISYDAEVIATAYEALKSFVLPKIQMRISNRKILAGLVESFGKEDQTTVISNIIDHAEKVPEEATLEAFSEIGLSSSQVQTLQQFINIKGGLEEVLPKLSALKIKNSTFTAGVDELRQILELLQSLGDGVIADMLIVRGLDYYTGTVVEAIIPEHREVGSICGGGRYENLASHFTEQKLPGVGISIGLTRLFYVLDAHQLIKAKNTLPIDLAIIPVSANEINFANQLATQARQHHLAVDVVLTDKKLGDKLSYSAKIASHATVIGENEAKTGKVMVKDLETGELQDLDEYLH